MEFPEPSPSEASAFIQDVFSSSGLQFFDVIFCFSLMVETTCTFFFSASCHLVRGPLDLRKVPGVVGKIFHLLVKEPYRLGIFDPSSFRRSGRSMSITPCPSCQYTTWTGALRGDAWTAEVPQRTLLVSFQAKVQLWGFKMEVSEHPHFQ